MSSLDNKKAYWGCRHGFFSEYLVPAFKFQKIFVFVESILVFQKIFQTSVFVFCLFQNNFEKWTLS